MQVLATQTSFASSALSKQIVTVRILIPLRHHLLTVNGTTSTLIVSPFGLLSSESS